MDNNSKEKNLINRGYAVGGTMAATGGGLIATDKILQSIDKRVKDPSKKLKKLMPKELAHLRRGALVTSAGGAGILGYSAYRHHKLNKENKNVDPEA